MRRALGPGTADAARPLLVAVSGGADSTALAAAVAFVAGDRARLVTVDHGLQPGSAEVAAGVVALGEHLGLAPTIVRRVQVGRDGGPEAAARTARRAALLAVAVEHRDDDGSALLALAHTRDDQAETVLLGLARGSGARSLAGMRASDGPWRRPLLGIGRTTTRAACAEAALSVHHDPHNDDRAYTRVRVRQQVLPVLEAELGPGVAEALARTADLLRDDADLLDGWAAQTLTTVGLPSSTDELLALDVASLRTVPSALLGRVVHLALRRAGVPPGRLSSRHVEAVVALVSDWHGQGVVDLPGGCGAVRRHGRLVVLGAGPAPARQHRHEEPRDD